MATVTEVPTVQITVNDREIAVPKGELIVESVKRLGLEIPIFCYHPRMKPVGMCRMCLVEVGFKQTDGSVRKMPKPQAACTLPASDGMVVYTDTELVHKDRRGVLEFLLVNHPLDCPICDRGGECPLQNNTLFYGPSTSRFVEIKRHLPKAFPLSKYVTLDLERCIQCGRCVRFTEEISGDAQLAFRFRGASMQPSTFELREFESKFSGNVIEICPVGALTSSKYRFRARPWDLQTRPGICTLCSVGCNVWVDYRVGKIARINGRTNEAVNEEWTCDRGKFGHDFYNSEKRLTKPLIREGDALVAADWARAYNEILRAFSCAGGHGSAGLAGPMLSNEDLYLFQKLIKDEFGSPNLDHRFVTNIPSERPSEIGLSLADIEASKAILLFGFSPADDLPMVHLRARKAWLRREAKIIVAHHEATEADSFAQVVLRYRLGTESDLAIGLLELVTGAGSIEATTEKTGVRADDLQAAVEILKGGASVVTSHRIYQSESAAASVSKLVQLARSIGGAFACFPESANGRGAELLRVWPSAGGLHTGQILDACIEGRVKALWLAGVDPLVMHPDRGRVLRAIETVDFLVVQGIEESEVMAFASVVLPMAAPAETDGTYTNMEGRVQRMAQVFAPKGEAKPAWRIFSEVSLRIKPATPFFNTSEVFAKIADQFSPFQGLSYAALDGEGVLIR